VEAKRSAPIILPNHQEADMPKGQRSQKEKRKPKKDAGAKKK
jgi:hypothetical protein